MSGLLPGLLHGVCGFPFGTSGFSFTYIKNFVLKAKTRNGN